MSTMEIGQDRSRLKDADESERRATAILESLKGTKTAKEAATELDLSLRRFKELRRRFLDAGRSSLEARPSGRPRSAERDAHRVPGDNVGPAVDPSTPSNATTVERELLIANLRILAILLGSTPPKPATSPDSAILSVSLSSLESQIIQTHAKIAEARAASIDPKSGRLHQDTQREEEFERRASVLVIVEKLRALGATWNWIAEQCGLPAATLRDWQQKMRAGKLRPIRRGRTGAVIDLATRQSICTTLALLGPNVSLKPLLAYFPEVPRRFLNSMCRRFRVIFRARGRIRSWRLVWKVPKTVWSVDGLAAPNAIDGWARKVLVVRDLGSQRTLELAPVTGESAVNVVAVLETLFEKHGAPMVLKLDNGSGFISEDVRALCARYRVVLLFSPPRSPWYQGSIERGMQSVRNTIDEIAARENRPGLWCGADLEVARIALDANPVLQAANLSPAETWRRSPTISAENHSHFYEQAKLHSATNEISPVNERQIIQDLLVETGLLEITPITIPCRLPKRGLVRTVAGHLGKLATLLQRRFADVLAAVRALLDNKHTAWLAIPATSV